MNTQFSDLQQLNHLHCSVTHTSTQRDDDNDNQQPHAQICSETLPEQIQRLRAAELFLKNSMQSSSISTSSPSVPSARSTSVEKPMMNQNLAWAFKISGSGLCVLLFIAVSIIWFEGAAPHSIAISSSHDSTSFARDITNYSSIGEHSDSNHNTPTAAHLAMHVPMFGTSRMLPIKRQAPVATFTLNAASTPAIESSDNWLKLQHEKEQQEKIQQSAVDRNSKQSIPSTSSSNPILASLSASAASRRLLCDVDLPADTFSNSLQLFGHDTTYNGGWLAYLLLCFYMIWGWGVLWMNYVNPLARHIGLTFNLHTNKGEATMLAIAGCLPNFIMNFFAAFYTNRDFGTGAVLGSGIMNTFVIPAVIFFALPHVGFPVYWWRASRDLVCFSAAVLIMVATTITGQQITTGESVILLLVFALYCYVLKKDKEIYDSLSFALYQDKKKKNRDMRNGKKKTNLQNFLEHTLFSSFITLCILTSICFVIWDSVHEEPFLTTANYAISAIFLLEAVLKNIAYGTLGYWSEPTNAFDGVLVVLIMFELIFGNGAVATSVRAVRLFRFLRALRGLRAVRAVRAARTSTFFHQDGVEMTEEEIAEAEAKKAAILAQANADLAADDGTTKPAVDGQTNAAGVPTLNVADLPSPSNLKSPSNVVSESKASEDTARAGQESARKELTIISEKSAEGKPSTLEEEGAPSVHPKIFISAPEQSAIAESKDQVIVLHPGSVVPMPPSPMSKGGAMSSSSDKTNLESSPAHGASLRSMRGQRSLRKSRGQGSMQNLADSLDATDPIASTATRSLIVEKDDANGNVVEEVVVITGNAGQTAEELAAEMEEDDDDDDEDDDDDVEEEEDEEDHWEELLAEENGKGPKGEVGEPVLDAKGKPTGLIKVFVKGVEPRRWSAFGPKWNPYRIHLGATLMTLMIGMTLLIIAVNIRQTIQGTPSTPGDYVDYWSLGKGCVPSSDMTTISCTFQNVTAPKIPVTDGSGNVIGYTYQTFTRTFNYTDSSGN